MALVTIVALGSGPAFAGLLDAVLFRRRPTWRWLEGTAIALAGCALVVAAQGGEAVVDVIGVVAALGAGASYAVYTTATKVLITRGVDSTVTLAAQFVLGAALLAPLGLSQPLGWALTGDGLLMLARLGIVTVGITYYLYGYGLRTLATSSAVMLNLAEPVMATICGVVVLDEHLPALGWLGAAIVVAGLAVGGTAHNSQQAAGRVTRQRKRMARAQIDPAREGDRHGHNDVEPGPDREPERTHPAVVADVDDGSDNSGEAGDDDGDDGHGEHASGGEHGDRQAGEDHCRA